MYSCVTGELKALSTHHRWHTSPVLGVILTDHTTYFDLPCVILIIWKFISNQYMLIKQKQKFKNSLTLNLQGIQ